MLDVRAEVEFNKGAFPNAVNLPILNDSERQKVGKCYKEHGQQQAINLGHQLVQGNIKQQRVAKWKKFIKDHPQAVLYCFRGGMRSGISQQWLKEVGVEIARIQGGYKALRQFLISSREKFLSEYELVIVAGRTGTGKTRVIQAIKHSLDLEKYAHHRGSAFGRFPQPQPTQINFENILAIDILQKSNELPNQKQFLVEDESHLIGRCALPEDLRLKMQQSPYVFIEETIESRIEVVIEEYVLQLSEQYISLDPINGWKNYCEYMSESLIRIKKRLGNVLCQKVLHALHSALELQFNTGQLQQHENWIEPLLSQYYDKMYDYQLKRKQQKCLFKGCRKDVINYFL